MTEPRVKPPCDTLVSLRDYVESRLDASQRALDLARELMDSRLDGLNHLRNTVMTKVEFDAAHNALMSRHDGDVKVIIASINELREWKAEQRGKASMNAVYISYFIGITGLIVSAVALIHELLDGV